MPMWSGSRMNVIIFHQPEWSPSILRDFIHETNGPPGAVDASEILVTLRKFNIDPENRGPLEKEIPIGNHHFQGLC